MYLIFGTRRFVECHLNSELIIRQAACRPSGARPDAIASATTALRRFYARRFARDEGKQGVGKQIVPVHS